MPEVFLPYDSFGHQKRMPMRFEADVYECEVDGEIPPELEGAYYRTGGDRQYPTLEDDMWFGAYTCLDLEDRTARALLGGWVTEEQEAVA